MRVTVTADDIAQGTPGSVRSCPIALAIDRATGNNGPLWKVDGECAYRDDEPDHMLPEAAREFVRSFDVGGYVEPFEFEVEV